MISWLRRLSDWLSPPPEFETPEATAADALRADLDLDPLPPEDALPDDDAAPDADGDAWDAPA